MTARPQRILITGATAGIGKHSTLELLRRGHHVIATGRRPAALAALASEATAAGLATHLMTVVLDVDSAASLDAAVAAVEAHTAGAGLDVLVNNAGYATAGPLIELDDATVRAQFETNVFGLLRVTRAFGRTMIAAGRGRIVNIGSVSGRIPAPMLGAYHASKYALEAISDALRMELRPFGIDVVIIEPGTIRTEFASRVIAEADAARPAGSRYSAVYARQAELAARFDRLASGPAPVTRALIRAVEARRPRARVVAPRRFVLMIGLVKLLPVCWVDWLMRRIAGLDRLAATAS